MSEVEKETRCLHITAEPHDERVKSYQSMYVTILIGIIIFSMGFDYYSAVLLSTRAGLSKTLETRKCMQFCCSTIKHKDFLVEVISEFKRNKIRTSIFVDPNLKQIEGAKETGTDRIELYTEAFAHQYALGNEDVIKPYADCAKLSNQLGLGVNAGHDLSLDNIKFFKENIEGLLEVSIGHALISESLYLGIENVIQMYLHRLS